MSWITDIVLVVPSVNASHRFSGRRFGTRLPGRDLELTVGVWSCVARDGFIGTYGPTQTYAGPICRVHSGALRRPKPAPGEDRAPFVDVAGTSNAAAGRHFSPLPRHYMRSAQGSRRSFEGVDTFTGRFPDSR